MASPISPWRTEFRATMALAWPLILANLTMAAIQATDVVLMGWLGPRPLAASALGLNLTFALTLIALGLVTASSPMMATALGARTRSVRDVRRTFRQSLWLVATVVVPIWLILFFSEPIILALGQEPALARDAQTFLRGYMWSALPFLAFQAMRNFVSALERPGWVLAISLVGILLNALLGYGLIFGAWGLPEWGIFGGGLASSIVWTVMALALVAVILTDRQLDQTELGVIALSCAATDDVTAWCLLAFVVGVAQSQIAGAVTGSCPCASGTMETAAMAV